MTHTEFGDPLVTMRSFIQRIATGPELSKDLSFEQAREGMRLILDGLVDPVQSAIFLIALRMKRESEDENRGVLQALIDATDTATVNVDELIDIADPYDGYTRGLPATPFLPAVLAACGLPAVSQGAEAVGPKYGITPRKIYRHAGLNVELSSAQAAARLEDSSIGWAYLDQQQLCPKLHNLLHLRTLIVKRPCLTTTEVLLGPLRAKGKTRLMTGYVHKAYPPVYSMLAKQARFDSALIIKGVEGGVIPSLAQPSRLFHFHGTDEEQRVELDPKTMGIEQTARSLDLPSDLPPPPAVGDAIAATIDTEAAAAVTVKAGMAALGGERGLMYDSLVYGGSMALWHCGRADSVGDAAGRVREVLDSGEALVRFKAG